MKKIFVFFYCFFSLLLFSFAGDTIITANNEKEVVSNNSMTDENIEKHSALIAQIITSAITVVVAYITGAVPSVLTKKHENAKIKKEKLEEFYIETIEWYNSCFLQISLINLVFNRQWKWDDLDKYVAQNPIKKGYLKSEIDIFLYFPEVKNNYEEVRKSIQDLILYSYEIRKQSDLASCRKVYEELVERSSKSFEEYQKKMQDIAILIK